jgi:HlyD family secretion protein
MTEKKKRTLIGIGLSLLVVGGVIYWWKGRSTPKKTAAPRIVTVMRGDLRVAVSATGVVEPEYIVEIKSKASGEVESVFVQEGELVPKGKKLVKINPIVETRRVNKALSEVRMARARTAAAWSKRKYVAAQLKRDRKLLKKGLVSGDAVATLAKEVAVQTGEGMVANAQLSKAKEALKEARDRLAETQIVSPVAGTILDREVQPGQMVASGTNSVSGGTTLLRIANLKQLYIRVKVDEADVAKLRRNQPATITADALPGKSFKGTVLRIAPQGTVESNVTVFEVVVAVGERGSSLLKPQMSANVDVVIEERLNVLLVPQRALQRVSHQGGRGRRGRRGYVVRLANGKRQTVRVGRIVGGQAEILSGLSENARIQIPARRGSSRRARRGGMGAGGRQMRRIMGGMRR